MENCHVVGQHTEIRYNETARCMYEFICSEINEGKSMRVCVDSNDIIEWYQDFDITYFRAIGRIEFFDRYVQRVQNIWIKVDIDEFKPSEYDLEINLDNNWIATINDLCRIQKIMVRPEN